MLLRFDETQEATRPRRYSFREQAILTVKLLLVAGGSLALLWMFERFAAP